MKIQVGHSPDADDAFMFYAMTFNKIDTGRFQFTHVLRDIETLNRWALDKKLELTAVSLHTYAYIANDYSLLKHGASIGENYGPIVVAKKEMTLEELKQKRIGIPGRFTTAFLALRLCLGDFLHEVLPFDQILEAVQQGRVDAGLIIHEGQLTYPQFGLKKVVDLGEWWYEKTSLPLPLGVNVIRNDLGPDTCSEISDCLRRSIDYAMQNRAEALEYAMRYARGTQEETADRFVGMYVNEFTRELDDRATQAIKLLLDQAHSAGIIPRVRLQIA